MLRILHTDDPKPRNTSAPVLVDKPSRFESTIITRQYVADGIFNIRLELRTPGRCKYCKIWVSPMEEARRGFSNWAMIEQVQYSGYSEA